MAKKERTAEVMPPYGLTTLKRGMIQYGGIVRESDFPPGHFQSLLDKKDNCPLKEILPKKEEKPAEVPEEETLIDEVMTPLGYEKVMAPAEPSADEKQADEKPESEDTPSEDAKSKKKPVGRGRKKTTK